MLLEWHSTSRSGIAWTILVLCICVVMQMLGTTMTLWNFDLQLDPVNAPLLEGFSLPAIVPDTEPSANAVLVAPSSERPPHLVSTHALFHPPIILV